MLHMRVVIMNVALFFDALMMYWLQAPVASYMIFHDVIVYVIKWHDTHTCSMSCVACVDSID